MMRAVVPIAARVCVRYGVATPCVGATCRRATTVVRHTTATAATRAPTPTPRRTASSSSSSSSGGTGGVRVRPLLPPIQTVAKPRAVLGVVCLPTDQLVEVEVSAFVAAVPGGGVEWRMTRLEVPGGEELTGETYRTAAGNVQRAAACLLPVGVVTAVSLSCTSMSLALGTEAVKTSLQVAHPAAAVTNMAEAVVAALAALRMKRVALVTPYNDELHATTVAMLTGVGVVVAAEAALGLSYDVEISAVSGEHLARCAEVVVEEAQRSNGSGGGVDGVDGVLLCCSSMRCTAPGFITALEARVGVPVVTSNQAQLWRLLRLSGVMDVVPGYGRLLHI